MFMQQQVTYRYWTKICLVITLFFVILPSYAISRGQRNKLSDMQDTYAAAIRWNDFEGAWTLLDPEYRKANEFSPFKLERYAQLQVTGYRDVGSSQLDDETVIRDIQISAINRHNQTERQLRYREKWRWDKESKRWWQMSGLPDFWQGQ